MKRLLLAGAVAAGLGISTAGYVSIQKHEGFSLVAYPDPATKGAPYTICWGHTGPEVTKGLRVTRAQCEAWLKQDIAIAERVLLKNVRVPMRQGEWDAYTSFIINVGGGNFARSTLLRKLNAGDWKGACNELPKWKFAAGVVLTGIVNRRADEKTTCLKDGPYVYIPKS